MKMSVFWYVALCSLVEVACIRVMIMEAASTSKISLNFYQIMQCSIPEDSHLCFIT
jgi:hypothetical protein